MVFIKSLKNNKQKIKIMQDLKATFETPIFKDSAGKTIVNVGHLAVAGLGAMALYFAIPAAKRKRLFN